MTADSLSRKPASRLSDAQAREAAAAAHAMPRTPPDRGKPRGLTRILRACGASWRGLAGAFREEAAFRQELAFAVVVIPSGVWFGRTGVERALLIAPMLFILIVELINSAIEATVDRIGFERHVLAGLAKDIGSAAVFMSFVLLGAVWLLVLLGR
jgi:diacylglycerol kinase (ATP)